MKKCTLFLILFAELAMTQCTSAVDKNLENAKFALDNNEFSSAISSANSVLNDDPANVSAARILAAAYLGRGGFSLHDIAVEVVGLDESDNNYRVLAPVLPADGDLADMKLAVDTLQGLEGLEFANLPTGGDTLDTDALKDAAYDLGIIQIVYHYAIAIYNTNFKSDPDHFNVGLLGDDTSDGFNDLAEAKNALVEFDNYLIAAGLDPTEDSGEFITDVRQTHCLLQGVDDEEGYSLATYQALVLCNLSEDSASEDTISIDPNFTDCSLSDPDDPGIPDAVLDCFDVDTVIE